MNRIENIFGIMPDQANQCQHSIWIGLISEKNANIIITSFLFIIQRKKLGCRDKENVIEYFRFVLAVIFDFNVLQ